MKRNIVLFIAIVCSLNSYSQDTLSVLFLGNSYTGSNNLPLLVKNLTTSAGKTLLTEVNTPGGFTLSNHVNSARSINKIKQGNWDYIVIQEQSQIPSIDYHRYNSMYPSLTQLKDTIDLYNPCAKIITYMTWGRRLGGRQCDQSNTYCSPDFVDFNHMQDSLTSAYLQISEQLHIQCAPVGVAWQNVLRDTTLVLHTGDNSHPKIDGSYLAACTIFSSIWKQGSSGLSFTAGLSIPLAQYYQSISDNTVFNSTNDWNLNINSPSAQFTESITGKTATFTNLSNSIDHTLSYYWDFGDGNSSVALNPTHSYTNDGTYTVTLMASNCSFSDSIKKSIQIATVRNEFEIYPNPTSDIVNIKVSSKFLGTYYTIYDNTGRTLLYGKIVSEITAVDLRNVSSGTYFVRVGDKWKKTLKLIKK